MEVTQADMGPQLLPFQALFFDEVYQRDQLAVVARGLGMEALLHSLLRLYCDPATLVLVVNLSAEEQDHYAAQLAIADVALAPRCLSADTSSTERQAIYEGGGVLFASSRVLVMDMLTGAVPRHLVFGLVVCHAHNVTPLSTEVG
jgi:DNA excision repair protein ERCC-4